MKYPAQPRIRRKNLMIDQSKLTRAREILGARSEADAIDQALSLLIFRDEVVSGVLRIGGSGGVQDVSDERA
jgi:hypothetical protein